MNVKGFLFYLLFVFVCVIGIFNTNKVTGAILVADGKTNSVIVVDPCNTAESVQLAVRELQRHIEQVTGVLMPIQSRPDKNKDKVNIFIGENQYTKQLGISTDSLKSDGFRIVARENWIVIIGRDYKGPVIYGMRNPWNYNEVYSPKWKIGAFGEAGTLYGVYEFLRQTCGVRWYMPGNLGMVVPRKERLEIGAMDLSKEPDFEYRYTWFCNFAEIDDDPIWYRRVGFGGVAPVQIIHTYDQMLKYKDTHPEYFALIDGQRDFAGLSTVHPLCNLCLSNPGLIKQWINDICDYFDVHPEHKVYPLAPTDGLLRVCDCPDCQSQLAPQTEEHGQFSNYVWAFIDKVARGVALRHPDRYVGCIAYERYCAPPTNIKLLSPNVAVMFCKTRADYYDKKLWDRQDRDIAEWRKKTNILYIWEYYLQSWRPWRNLPTPFTHIIATDLKALKGIIKGEFIESESWEQGDLPCKMNFPGMQHLNLYVTARLYWDVDQDVDELLDEYFRLFYGPAAEEMKAFWITAEKYWTNQDKSDLKYGFGGTNPMKVFTPERLKTLSAFIGSARSRAKPESIYRKRIDLIAAEFARGVQQMTNDRVINPPEIIVSNRKDCEIVLDGRIEKVPWKNTQVLTFVSKEGNDPEYQTKAYVMWDDDYLYFAFENMEPDMDKLQAKATQRDQSAGPALWDEDGVEVFICPDLSDLDSGYQFIVNARGIIWDGLRKNTLPDKRWNSNIETAYAIDTDCWLLELKIPWSDIDINSPPDGKTVLVNLFRNRVCDSSLVTSCWSPTLANNNFTTSRFGKMTFKR